MLNKVEDFLRDDDFIRFVLNGISDAESKDEVLGKEHSEIQVISDEAKAILLSSSNVESGLSLLEINELKRRIFDSVGINAEL